METKQLIALIVALVVVGGGVWYFSSGNSAIAPTEEGVTGANTSANQAEGSATLADLMMRTGAYTCNVDVKASSANGNAASSGTVYIGNGRMRGDFSSTVPGMGDRTIESHMISMDGYVYTWSDMMPQGVKMQVSADGSTSGQAQGGLDSSAAVDYHCSPWAIDANRFKLPDNVTFMTFGGVQ